MCGIVGYVGRSEAVPVLLEGLRRLEYRGYDSAGIATIEEGVVSVRKEVGRIDNLAKSLSEHPVGGTTGISHTRWATHGKVTRENAHPHFDRTGRLALVHNGVIENYAALRSQLEGQGHVFTSQTDTEVLAHLIGRAFDGSPDRTQGALVAALREALGQVSGTYGIALVHAEFPGLIIGARRGSPLVLGIGKGEHFLASDVSAIVAHTREVVYRPNYVVSSIA
jgi:glucosamine--fructose-6-phosphate aminotransferase (isomerizing)